MKLTQLKIHKYRGAAPGCELSFSPSLNLILGENGTGRTTLLELLTCALGSDFSGLAGEELSLEYGFALAGMEVWISVRNEKRSASIDPAAVADQGALLPLASAPEAAGFEPSVEMAFQPDAPAPRLVMRLGAGRVSWEVGGRAAFSQVMRWSVLERPLWVALSVAAHFLEPEAKAPLQPFLRDTLLLGSSRFDEALGAFDGIGATHFTLELRPGEVVPLGLMAVPRWLPGLLRERVAREPAANVIEIRHDEVRQGFLAKFVSLAGFASAKLRVELLERRPFEGGERLEFGHFAFSFTRRDGSALSQAHLGFGQKRLLSFLYYLELNGDFVVADELANGLHPRWIEACLEELGERQAFLTSQNPLLIERVAGAPIEDLRRSLILCQVVLREGREQWSWSNPGREQAEALSGASRRPVTSLR